MRTHNVHLLPVGISVEQLEMQPRRESSGCTMLRFSRSTCRWRLSGTVTASYAPFRTCFATKKKNMHKLSHIRLLTALDIITNASHYNTQHPAYQDIIHDNTLIGDPYNCLLESITRPGTDSEIMTIYDAASAALAVVLSALAVVLSTSKHNRVYTCLARKEGLWTMDDDKQNTSGHPHVVNCVRPA